MPIKKKTEEVYRERIEHACRFINGNLYRPLNLDEVADASQFSRYHFHRVFFGIMGETVNEYVNRRRLEMSANRLVYDQSISITDLALDMGFSSSANYSKAFKAFFGVTPSQMRNPDEVKNSKIGKIKSKYGKDFHPTDLYPQFIDGLGNEPERFSEELNMNIIVRELDELTICRQIKSSNYEQKEIYKAWDKLIAWANAHGISEDEQQRFAVCHDNPLITSIEKCRYDAAIAISASLEVTPPFVVDKIPSGKYAVGYYKGDPTASANFHMCIYKDWLPNSGFEPENHPLLERYFNDARDDGHIELEVYIKLKPLSKY